MKELTHTLKGLDAASAKILDEVTSIFHGKGFKTLRKNDWRLEFYIIQVMASDMCNSYEVRKSKIMKMVELCCGYENNPVSEWNTAFRRLTTRKFLYGSYTQVHSCGNERERSYGLKLSKYDTAEVEA